MPALLTRMSRRPYSASIQSAASCADFVVGHVERHEPGVGARLAQRALGLRPRASSRAPTSTVTPRAPSWRAVSKPIPLLAPVIRAIVVVMPPTL